MLKGFRIKGVDGGWLHIEETEDKQSVRICVDHGDAQTSIWLDRAAWEEVLDMKYTNVIDVDYPQREGSDGDKNP